MRIRFITLALGMMTALPAFPDIMDITFTPGFQISGSVVVRCDSCGGFGQSSTVVPISSTPNSVSGIVSFMDISGRMASVTDQITQNNSSTSESFDVSVAEGITFRGIGAEWGSDGLDVDRFTVTFTLTTESSLHLSNTFDGSLALVNLVDSMGNLEFSSPGQAFDTSLLLAPGTYTLTGNDVFRASGNPRGFSTFIPLEADFNLSADFTAVPEPAAGSIFVISCLACVGIVVRHRKLAH
jgi:hypothetical protein